MNEVLFKKIKYLLSFKLNSNDSEKYLPLLEKLTYDFIISMEQNYNTENTNAYYNKLLNKLNHNIKSIIAPSNVFYYHSRGFLELNTSLNGFLENYIAVDVAITKELKEDILKRNYFSQFLTVIKSGKDHNGLISLSLCKKDSFNISIGTDVYEESPYSKLEEFLTEVQAIELSKLTKIYKKKYRTIYPDGTTYKYFIYSKSLDSKNQESINMVKILEMILEKKHIMKASLDGNLDLIDEFNKEYDELLGELRYDSVNKKRTYTWWKLIAEYLYFIDGEKTGYRKLEYIKNLNEKLFLLYEEKIKKTLEKNITDQIIINIFSELRILEENMLYNEDVRLHQQLEHVKIFKRIKKMLELKKQELFSSSDQIITTYKIYNRDKNQSIDVISAMQPIVLKEYYVTMDIKNIKHFGKKYLIKADFSIYNNEKLDEIRYSNISLSLDAVKYIYSSSDLDVPTKESESIRKEIASRISNSSIMNIIINERESFLGDFVYEEEFCKCIVYKNSAIIEYLMKEGNEYV